MAARSYLGDVNAPPFPGGLDWLGTDRPVSLADLRGKIVILDFWTSCCINCMHILPQLRKIERRYPDEIVVIGVHSPKFLSEQDTDVIRWSMLRHGVEHPVVNDTGNRIWNSYAVRAWPTLVFIDPRGKVIGQNPGEIPFEALDGLIGDMITEFEGQGLIDRRPVSFQAEQADTGVLRFPSKLLTNGDHLYIADTGNHRVLECDTSGLVLRTFGGPDAGLVDGPKEQARFDRPRGLAIARSVLYVADTENHVLRAIDLPSGTVATVAGTGQQGMGFTAGGLATTTPMRSPWDLAVADEKVFIAMAGAHQIWVFDPEPGYLYPWAGAGPESLRDGPLPQAYLAQPSGLSVLPHGLVFADSETSAIRRTDLDMYGDVSTYVGEDLFVFGDVDGVGADVRLQHPIGVHAANGVVYIADSFNNKIKVLDPATKSVHTIAGSGMAGAKDGAALEAEFNEPEGLWHEGGLLYVADTNNSSVRIIQLDTATVTTLEVRLP